jgi:hypothetical protein
MLKAYVDGIEVQTYELTVGELQSGCHICAALMCKYSRLRRYWLRSSELSLRWISGTIFINVVFKRKPWEGAGTIVDCYLLQEILPEVRDLEADFPPMESYRPPENSSDPAAHRLVASWLRHCVTNHHECRRSCDSTFMPPRLLDLTKDKPRLVETGTFIEHEDYATLSHCWGKNPTFTKLSADNYERFSSGFALDELAQTFRDAIFLCKNLGIRYIWIDSYVAAEYEVGGMLSPTIDFVTLFRLIGSVGGAQQDIR